MGFWRRFLRTEEQAHPAAAAPTPGLPYGTPVPNLADYGDADGPSNSLFALFQPSPDHLNYAFLHSDEWARTIVRIRNEIWRRGLEVQPTHPLWCVACGVGVDDGRDGCPMCRAPREFLRPPDENEKQTLTQFIERANTLKEGLVDVGERKTEEGLKHGRGLIVFKYDITVLDGQIHEMVLKGVHAGDPGKIVMLRDKKRRPGGAWICVLCRVKEAYKPEKQPGKCPDCKATLHEAVYAEYTTYAPGADNTANAYYLASEVHETRWPYKDGSSPATRLWPKITTLLWMDRRSANAVAPRVDFPPEKLLYTVGGDAGSIDAWMKRQYEERKKNPRRFAHLHIPSPPGGLQELKSAVGVVDLGDTVFREQQLDVREKFEQAIHAQYHVSPMQSGNTESSGGLNNEGLQLRSTAQVAEDIQRHEEVWLRAVAEQKGVLEWTYKFPPAIEEDEARRADLTAKHLQNAKLAAEQGLTVKWVDGAAVIQDGDVEEPAQPPIALPASPPPASGASAEVKMAQPTDATFGGPSQAVEAADALWINYADVPPGIAAEINEHILDAMSQPQGWSVTSVSKRIQPILEVAGIDEHTARTRARAIARMETRSLQSEYKVRNALDEMADRGNNPLWVNRGARDHRRTKLSWWIDQSIGAGKTLPEVIGIIEQGIQLAKEGAFTKQGALSGTRGEPIQLPADFQRRGFLAHFNDRDDYVQTFRRG